METQDTMQRCRPNRIKKIMFGILVIAAGKLWLLFNIGFLDPQYFHVVFSWKMLLFALGFLSFFGRESRLTGIVLMIIGACFALPDFFVFDFQFKKIVWPTVLMVIGVIILIKKGIRPSHHHFHKFHHHCRTEVHFDESNLAEGMISETNIFSGRKRIVQEKQFRGGEITNIFGGSEIDMRGCGLATGRNVLNVTCIFGGVGLIVPSDWNVLLETENVLGGFADKRRNVTVSTSDAVLVIKGTAVFGGGEIKSESES